MIDLTSVLFLTLIHLSYIGLGLCWSEFQKKSYVSALLPSLGLVETLFKHWAMGVFFSIIALYVASFMHLYWVVFGIMTLLGLGSIVRYFIRSRFFQEMYRCCKMQQGRTAAGSLRYLKKLPPLLIILLAGGTVFMLNANLSLSSQVHCVSGMGNWALKSKIMFLEAGLHTSYFDHATHYGKFSYPPGFPLINAPLFIINGADHDVILKLNSTLIFTSLFVLLSHLFLIHWKWFSLPAIVLLLGFFLGDAAWSVSYWFYSEPLLILCCAISTLLFFRGDTRSALLAAAGASMIKQEGFLFLLLIGLVALIFSKNRKQEILLIVLSNSPYLSWKIMSSLHGINDSDFDFNIANFHAVHLNQAWKSVKEISYGKWESYSGAFVMLPVALLVSLITRNWKILAVLGIAFLIIAIYLVAISFSSVDDIDWHLSATTRYLMLPAVILFVSLSVLPMRSRASVSSELTNSN